MAALQGKEVVAVVRLTRRSGEGVSIIIPVYNEEGLVTKALSKLISQLGNHDEILVVDGGSSDATVMRLEQIEDSRLRVLLTDRPGRAAQMNYGATHSSKPLLFFLHVDTTLPSSALSSLRKLSGTECWGRFDVSLDNNALAYRIISWFINWRSSLTGISTGDQGIFIDRCLFEQVGGYANQRLMEDVEISKQLKALSWPVRLRERVKTSSRKWETGGVVQTVWLMWCLRAQYARGVSPDVLHAKYYG